ncbi:unnamed protein product, partial [Symbiodinium sp. KB8]
MRSQNPPKGPSTHQPTPHPKQSEHTLKVGALKERLCEVCGMPRFRQRLFCGDAPLEDNARLDAAMDIQLVLLPFCDVPSPQLLDLKIAIRNGSVVEVEKMLQCPLDPNVAIHEACWAGQAAVLRLLLEARAEVNLANSGGQTPLHLASMKGHQDLVQLLLGVAADVSLVDMRGKTAALLAADANFSDIVTLLEKGAAPRLIAARAKHLFSSAAVCHEPRGRPCPTFAGTWLLLAGCHWRSADASQLLALPTIPAARGLRQNPQDQKGNVSPNLFCRLGRTTRIGGNFFPEVTNAALMVPGIHSKDLLKICVCTICPSANDSFTGCPIPKKTQDCSGDGFIECWTFFTAPDPTHGDVIYVAESVAIDLGLYSVKDGVVYLKSIVGQNAPAKSIRLQSRSVYQAGHVWLIDIAHMPTGQGTWPAWWSFGPDWPNNGEIDTIETVNIENVVQSTLHTSAGCFMYIDGISTPDCVSGQGQSGCGVDGPYNSAGPGFNANGGGVFATQWTNEGIYMWFFPRDKIPADLDQGNTYSWGQPYVTFPFYN